MKKIINLVIAFLTVISLASQNLVSNESFEKYKKCPEDLGEFDKVSGWVNPSKGTPDFYSSCFKTGKNNMGLFDNYMGSQSAKEGEAYAGIIAYSQRSADYREYLAQKLSKPLQKDSVYLIKFFVSLSDFSTFAVSSIGIYLCADEISSSSWNPINAIPQIENPFDIVVTDKDDWIEISAEYTATGEERFIIIGNFKKDKDSNIENISNDNTKKSDLKAYYYVDCVSVELCPESDCIWLSSE